MKKQNKQGVSLIVLVITIIVMIILAGTIILSLSSSNNVFDKTQEAVNKTNLNQLNQLAQVKWAEAYARGARTQEALEQAVIDALDNENISLDPYEIEVSTLGVTIELKKTYTLEEIEELSNVWAIGKENSIDLIAVYDEYTKTLKIKPNGVETAAMMDFTSTTNPFKEIEGLEKVVIKTGTISVGKYAFDNSDSITSIELPEGLTSIGSGAFQDMGSLLAIHIPSSVTTMEGCLFAKSRTVDITFGEDFDITSDGISSVAFGTSWTSHALGNNVFTKYGIGTTESGSYKEGNYTHYWKKQDVIINGKQRTLEYYHYSWSDWV